VVASKVNFTNSVEDMEQFVTRAQIPKDLGGEEDWSYKYIEPAPNENSIMQDTATRDKLVSERETIVKAYEKATLEWIDHDAAPEALAIKERRHALAAGLREDYWRLDPYVRARSLYDRYGVIQPGGKLQFYPPATAPVANLVEPTTNGAGHVETSHDDVD
jgi:hypothetical protein